MAGTLAVSGQKQACLGPQTRPWGPCTPMPSQASARPLQHRSALPRAPQLALRPHPRALQGLARPEDSAPPLQE